MLCLIIVLYLKDHFNSSLSAITTPSLNAMFHAFTFLYIVLAVGTNPYKPAGGIAFSYTTRYYGMLIFLIDTLMCDDFKAIAIGISIWCSIHYGWWALIKSTRSRMVVLW